MTTHAKNVVLGYVVIGMLAVVAYSIFSHATAKPYVDTTPTITVLLPKPQPMVVEFAETPLPELVITYDPVEFECMRLNIYHEAGNQSHRGMEAVALVTLNRVRTKHYPTTVCGVVNQYAYNSRGKKVCQFSWRCNGRNHEPKLLVRNARGEMVPNLLEIEAWDRATQVAEAALEGRINDFLGRATHYHADYVNPKWANVPSRYHRLAVVGKHIFYRDIRLGLKEAA